MFHFVAFILPAFFHGLTMFTWKLAVKTECFFMVIAGYTASPKYLYVCCETRLLKFKRPS